MSYAPWIQQAESDLDAANLLSGAGHHSQAVWLAAQSVEKAHKAILAALGLRYEDKHFKHLGHGTAEISKLLPAALHEPMDPQISKMIATLESRALASRYPAPAQTTGATPGIVVAPASSITASENDVADAQKLLNWCRDRIERAVRAAQAMKAPSATTSTGQ